MISCPAADTIAINILATVHAPIRLNLGRLSFDQLRERLGKTTNHLLRDSSRKPPHPGATLSDLRNSLRIRGERQSGKND
jgi:hypothetical protein